MNDDNSKFEVYGADVKVWLENGTVEFTINEEDAPWVMKAFHKFFAEYLRDIAAKTDPL